MIRFRVSARCLTMVAYLAFVFMTISSCGSSGIGDLAGGGTGGTGISTGAITGFGSVEMNGAHYKTDGAKKVVRGEDKTRERDSDVFSVGMVVTLLYSSGDNNATEIDYEPNLVGPIGAKVAGGADPPTIMILGLPVIVDNATLFADLNLGNVVEVSGFVDNLGRIRATYLKPPPMAGEEFEIKGYVSGASGNSFKLGPLPDFSGNTVTVSYNPSAIQGLPGEPVNGMYVQVTTTDTQPVNGMITASEVKTAAARTDFPENTLVDLDGLVTKLEGGSENSLSFDLEGKAVQTDGSTEFIDGAAREIQPNGRVQVQGKETGGVLHASKIFFR